MMETEKKFTSEKGTPTCSVGTPVEPTSVNLDFGKRLSRIDAKLNLLLSNLGVSTTSLEEETNETD